MRHIQICTTCLFSLLVSFSFPAMAQNQSLSATMEVYVFPKAGQDANKQSMDEASCYDWAESNTGTDPFALQNQQQAAAQQADAQQQSAQQSTQGSGAKGALGGAAVGAVIGEIADDDAGKGAAWGAALGAVRGRRKSQKAADEQSAQAEQQYQQTVQYTNEQIENFKKAFSVCLEANDYMVKY